MDFLTDSVADIVERVRSRQQRASEVVEHAIGRIEALDGSLNAFISWDGESALAQAAAVDAAVAAGADPGPLAGVPLGVKDLEDAAGFTTTRGSALFVNDPPATGDSVLVRRLRSAGAIVIGKTNTPEYGHKGITDSPAFGPARSPWGLEYSAGGSSGGTAAAIASGMIPLGTGSDGGGSIRIPAALCGLTALKTESGRIPISGTAMPGSGLLSTNGPMGRSAMDTAVALDVVRGPDGHDPLSLPVDPTSWAEAVTRAEPPTRVIWSPTMGFAAVDTEVHEQCTALVERLAAEGTEIVEIGSIFPTDPIEQWIVLWSVARYKAQGHLIGTLDFDRLSDSIKPQIMLGSKVSGVEHSRALDDIYRLNSLVEDAFDSTGASLLLCPTAATHPPPLDELGVDPEADVGWVRFTYGINLTRHPAGTMCTGLSDAGLPIALQVISRHHGEPSALAALAVLEGLADPIGPPPVS